MADAVVNIMVENLWQLLSGNTSLITGVEEEFTDLLEEVHRLKVFLYDAVKFHNQRKQLVYDIQRTVHRAEDVIDKFTHQLEKSRVRKLLDVGHLAQLRNLAIELKGIIDMMKHLREDNYQTLLDDAIMQGPSFDGEVVGFDEEAQKVIKRLIQGSTDLEIVPVVGIPGLGKTTLARKIYNDPDLPYEFHSIISIYVGRFYKVKGILHNILKFFTKRTKDFDDEDVDGLAKVIAGFMGKGGRCLIVLDDVWEKEVIEFMRKLFPENKKGHRIMMTTCDRDLGSYANADPHDLKFLTKEECFELLVKRAFGKGSFPDELVGPGESIAGKCDGVPVAVEITAGVLRGRPKVDDWLEVERNMVQHFYKNDNHVGFLKFLEISFHRLPLEVQTCFLYCGIFPRGFEIPSWKLIRLWIAEGLIKAQSTYTLEEMAEFYLNDLVNRNLLILMKKRCDGQIKTCCVHDMLHEFCKKEASNRLLFHEIHPTPDESISSIQDQDSCRRLCIRPSIMHDFLCTRPAEEHVRSFYCFSSKEKLLVLPGNEIRHIHKAFPLIRVLDIESLKFSFSKEFYQLFHLRYIGFSGDFKTLPETFGNLRNLQTIIVVTSSSEPFLDIKADIWNMVQLRHLHTNIPAKLQFPTSTIGKASSLQTLSKVAPESCKKHVLAKACHLRKLSIQGHLAAFFETSGGGITDLEELKCLENLKLLNDIFYMNKVIHLPARFFILVRTVKKLTLANTRFDWSEAGRLGQCKALEVLKLIENAFTGDVWKPEEGGFSALRVLWIERLDLKSWEASNLNFPILMNLVIICCDKLKAVPLGLADIPNLQEMRLMNTSKAVKSAKEILERKASGAKLRLTIFPPETESNASQ